MDNQIQIKPIQVNVYSLLLLEKNLSNVLKKLAITLNEFPNFSKQALILDLYKLKDITLDEVEHMVQEISIMGFTVLGLRHFSEDFLALCLRHGIQFYVIYEDEIEEIESGKNDYLTQDINNFLDRIDGEEDELDDESNDDLEDDDKEGSVHFADDDEDEEIEQQNSPRTHSSHSSEQIMDNENDYVWMRPPLVIDKPIRSGQQYYAEKSDIIVNAVVNEGAEIIADGNIHVYSIMRGRALAGVNGDTSARIFCLNMQAQLISIAGVYRTFDTKLPPSLASKPVLISLNDDKQLAIKSLTQEDLLN